MTAKPTKSQATRNVRLGFGLLFLSLIIFVIAFSWTSWQSEKQDELNELSLLAELSGKSINSYFSHFENNLNVLSQEVLDANGTFNLERVRLLLKRFKETNPEIANVNINDPNGQILASAVSPPGTVLPNISQQNSFILGREALLKGQVFNIGRPTFGLMVKKWTIPLRNGVRDKNGKLRYILNAPLPLEKQQSFWQNLSLPENAQMGLLRDDGYLLSIYPLPKSADIKETYGEIRTGALASLLRQQSFPQRGIAEGYNTVARANYHFAFYRLPNYPITFFVTAPISNLQTKWWEHTQPFYLSILIFLASGFGVYYWTAKRQAKWATEREQQEEKFRSIYEGANDAIMLLSEQAVFDCNQRTLEIFGLTSKSEFVSCHPSDFSPPLQPDGQDSRTAANEKIAMALKQGTSRFEWVHRRKNGEDFPAEVVLSAFTDGGKKILQATVRDITDQKNAEAALQATLEHLQAANYRLDIEKELNQKIIETSPIGICIYDERGDCVTANPAMARHIGATQAQAAAQNFHHIESWKRSGIYNLALQSLTCDEPLSTVVTLTTSFGKNVQLGVTFCSLHSGGQHNLMHLTMDLTESMHAQQALEESEERFRRVISEAPIPIMIHAEDGEVLEVNKAWIEATGYAHSDIPTTRSWTEKAYGKHAQQVQQKINPLYRLKHRVDQGEFVITCKDGSSRNWHITAAPVGKLSDGRRYVISTAQDITERKAAQEQVEFLAYHDFLTGLPNRLLAKDHYGLAVSFADREDTKVALVFLDLDNFKIINDSLGHMVGDALLKVVATRLKECLRDTDTLSRQGGDEFLILLGGVPDLDAITRVVEKILARLTETFSIEGNELSTSLSIGIAVYPDDGKDYDTLLKKADTAMYQSKDAGRSTFRFFAEQMNADAVEHLQIRNNLRKGLEREEFVLHYQPQLDLSSNVVIGAEALIRWNHPEFGMMPPMRFIPIAEESGLIVQMGEWVLLEACRQAVAWRKAGLPELVIAVNLSSVQFKRGNLEKSVIHALSTSGLDPTLLELELTESILLQNTERVLGTVQRLKSLGVKLSIDDFGTGYSSLSYLTTFAVDKLKIDQSFIRDMADDPNDAIIVRTIIQMAKSVGAR